MREAVRVIYSGKVQGVGFRYSTERLASHFDVCGYVRNLVDGNVELVAEGEKQTLVDFLQAILDGPMKRNIKNAQIVWEPATNQYNLFGIASE